MTIFWHDLRSAARGLLKAPGFTATVVLALALGLGVNIAIFDTVNGILLRPLPVGRPQELASLAMGPRDQPFFSGGLSYPDYLVMREERQVFSAVLAANFDTFVLGSEDGPRGRPGERPAEVAGEFVTENFFDALGLRAALGRTFSPEEGSSPSAEPAMVISHALWRSRFNGDPGVIGRRVRLNTHSYTVIGVLPPGFKGISGQRPIFYWIPLVRRQGIYGPEDDFLTNHGLKQLRVLARLAPGVSLAGAQVRMNVLAETLARDFPTTNSGTKITVFSEIEGRYGPGYQALKQACLLALFIAGLVLLISCANVANLLLARGQRRTRELSIRLALGAGRGRIVRQLMTESILLALVAGLLGGIMAFWFGDLLHAILPPMPFTPELKLEPDARTIGWAVGVSLLAGVVFGALPAWRASRASLTIALKTDLRTEGHRLRRAGLRQALVVAQIAISIIVIASGGLFFRSLKKIEVLDPGFRAENLISALVNPGLFTDDEGQVNRFFDELLRRLERRPGVRSAAACLYMPLVSLWGSTGPIIKEGDTPPPPNRSAPVSYSVISARYLETMETPLLQGRDFLEEEHRGSGSVAIVNRQLARQLFGSPEEAIGKRFRMGGLETPPLQIVGVVKDGRYLNLLEEPRPWILLPRVLPQLHDSNWTMRTVLIRAASTRDIPAILAGLAEEVAQLDRRLPIEALLTAGEHLSFSLYGARMAAGLGAILSVLALGLATLGIYSVMTYAVSQRTREIGIRMALGGQVGDVLRLVLGQGLWLILVGVGAGALGAWAISQLLAGLLYGVSASDPLTYVGAVSLLMVVALVAMLVPARRATRVDPMVALRYD